MMGWSCSGRRGADVVDSGRWPMVDGSVGGDRLRWWRIGARMVADDSTGVSTRPDGWWEMVRRPRTRLGRMGGGVGGWRRRGVATVWWWPGADGRV